MSKIIFVLIIVSVLLAAFIPLLQFTSNPHVRNDLRIGAAPATSLLASTSWPTVFHDMKRTNRTFALGIQTQPTTTKWRKNLPQRFGGGSLRGATVGINGRSIYLAGGFNGLYSLNKQNGNVEWQRFAETGMGATACPPALADNEKWIDMPPTISSDGTLFVTAEYGWGMALDPEIGGTENGLKYKYYLCKTEQAVAMDANAIYAGSWDGKFFAYNINGTYQGTPTNPKDHSTSRRKWTYKFTNPGRLYTYGTPAIGDDGTIYFGFKGIYAFHPDVKCPTSDPTQDCAAQLKWFTPISGALETGSGAVPFVGVSIGPEGNIYMLHNNLLHAVNKNGTYLWKITTGASVRGRNPAIADDGTVYFGSDDGYLYAINPNGTTDTERIKWKFRLGACQAFSNALIDGSNTIYINTNCDTGGNGRLYAVNANGTEKWRFNSGVRQSFLHDQQMSMDSDGTLFFNTGQDEFAALQGSGTGPTFTPTPTADPNITSTPTPTRTPTPQPLRTGFLSDQNWISATTGDPSVPVLKDKANNGTASGGPITLASTQYPKGIGTHANSEIIYNMAGQCSEFHSLVGVDDSAGGNNGSVIFRVYADNTLLLDTGVLTGNSAARAIDITATSNPNLVDKQLLRLVVTNAGDNFNYDRADWASARVVCNTGVSGDITGDGHVTIADYNLLLSQFGGSGSGDFNGNTRVDIFDYNLVIKQFGL